MLAEDNQKSTDGTLVTKYICKLLTSSDWVPQLQRTNYCTLGCDNCKTLLN